MMNLNFSGDRSTTLDVLLNVLSAVASGTFNIGLEIEPDTAVNRISVNAQYKVDGLHNITTRLNSILDNNNPLAKLLISSDLEMDDEEIKTMLSQAISSADNPAIAPIRRLSFTNGGSLAGFLEIIRKASGSLNTSKIYIRTIIPGPNSNEWAQPNNVLCTSSYLVFVIKDQTKTE